MRVLIPTSHSRGKKTYFHLKDVYSQLLVFWFIENDACTHVDDKSQGSPYIANLTIFTSKKDLSSSLI